MLWMKVSTSMVDELPILLIMWLQIYKIKGALKPSPIAPMVPKIIRNQSSPSACMKMDLIDPFMFLFSFITIFLPIFLTHPFFRNKEGQDMFQYGLETLCIYKKRFLIFYCLIRFQNLYEWVNISFNVSSLLCQCFLPCHNSNHLPLTFFF